MAQLLSMVWFVAAARMLSDEDFGVVATGLTFFAIFAGLGDMGTSRTVVRFVAADHGALWPVYIRSLGLRVLGGVAVGAVTAAIIAVSSAPVSPLVVLLAGALGVVSGATELGYAALRAVGRVKSELVLLVVERVLFLAVGLIVISRGGGPIAVLVVYVATNLLSAVIVGLVVLRIGPRGRRQPPSLTDTEARFTAIGFALVTVAPRVGPLLVALFAGAAAVGEFAVAQRPVEAVALFTLSTAAPVLPIVRSRVASGRWRDAERASVAVVGAFAVVLAPILSLFVVVPSAVIDLFVGAERYPGAELTLRILAITAFTWSLRGVGEFVLLAEERARAFLGVVMTGLVVTVVASVPMVIAWGATGAAVGVLLAEVVMTALLLRAVPALCNRDAMATYVPAVVLVGAAAVVFFIARSSAVVLLGAAGILFVPAMLFGLRLVRRLELV